jgi:hypothetical protein
MIIEKIRSSIFFVLLCSNDRWSDKKPLPEDCSGEGALIDLTQ